MSRKLSELEDMLQVVSRNRTELITEGTGLDLFNAVYRRTSLIYPWPELRKQNTTLSTTANTATYTWPDEFIPANILSVEIQDGDDNDKYKPVTPPKNEDTWTIMQGMEAATVPSHYIRARSGTVDQIIFAPAPKYGSKTIRITAVIEAPILKSEADRTIFLQNIADDALVYTLAGEFLEVDGEIAFADRQLQKAQAIFTTIFGNAARVE